MTIQVRISNEDSRENAVIQVRNTNSGVPIVLKGGEEAVFLIYKDNDLLIQEVSNWTSGDIAQG